MLRQEVIDLIERGYDDDVIMMTMGLSSVQLEFLKKQIEKENTVVPKKTYQVSKLKLLRDRYNAAYNTVLDPTKIEKKPLTEEQRAEVTRRLDEAEKIIPDVIAGKIKHNEVKKLYSYLEPLDLPADLARRAYSILPEDNLKRIRVKADSNYFKQTISNYRSRFFTALSDEIDSTNDLDELNKISRELTKYSSISYVISSSLNNKVIRRITAIKMDKFKEFLTIPKDKIDGIVDSILDPNASVEDIKENINKTAVIFFEGRKRAIEEVDTNKNLARLRAPTMEGSAKQVNHQVIDALQQEGLDIEDIYGLLDRLVKLGIDRGVAIHAILNNMINNERYDDAEEFAGTVYKARTEDVLEQNSRRIALSTVRRARISKFIMRGINAKEGTVEEENNYYQLILSGIEKSRLDPQGIALGKTKDGLKTITWADVMEKPRKKKIEDDFSK